ncbi:MAG: flavodoxin family protein [Methanolinea sp.]|nr:flavodoxin family protein [Methanolinea sp.]
MGYRVIGLLGSPLTGGNTAKLLERALQGVRDAGCETELIVVANLDFQPCMEMMYCREHGTCMMDDDMQAMYRKFRDLDGLIVATPVMTMGIPGALKGFMDRFQVFFMAKYERKESLIPKERIAFRRGLYIGISGMKIPNVFDGAKLTMKAFFDIIDVKYQDELLIRDMDHIRDITTRPDQMEGAYKKGFELGRLLVEGK